jgi:O-acetyl-ADP-ribose deacetylase (regulator of RNase III)
MPLEIRISVSHPLRVEGGALVRPVNGALEGITPWSREVEVAGGDGLRDRLAAMESLPPGGVMVTPGGRLPFALVLHAVVLSPDEGVTRGVVVRAVENALRRAGEWGVETLVLPPLGVGPGQLSAEEGAEALADVLAETWAGDDARLPATILVPAASEGEAAILGATLARGLPGVRVRGHEVHEEGR